MEHYRLDHMTKGWFVGNFDPAAHRTSSCEVGFKFYRQGDKEAAHHHKIATEITLVASGRVRMCGRDWEAGDIIVLSPGENTSFEALTDATTVVVKTPGANNDKYFAPE
jgi:hypothetical protein